MNLKIENGILTGYTNYPEEESLTEVIIPDGNLLL